MANWVDILRPTRLARKSLNSDSTIFFVHVTDTFDGDLVYFQPHSAPGVYARAFLEGRRLRTDLDRYRQEVPGPGPAHTLILGS